MRRARAICYITDSKNIITSDRCILAYHPKTLRFRNQSPVLYDDVISPSHIRPGVQNFAHE
jgi:hypothetical protein